MLFDSSKKYHVLNSINGRAVFSTNDETKAGDEADRHTVGSGIPHMVMQGLYTSSKTTTVVRRPIVESNEPEEARVVIRVGEPVIDPSVEEDVAETVN